MIQTPPSTYGGQNYSANNAASINTTRSPISPPLAHKRNDSSNGVDVTHRQNAWPSKINVADMHNNGENNANEGTG